MTSDCMAHLLRGGERVTLTFHTVTRAYPPMREMSLLANFLGCHTKHRSVVCLSAGVHVTTLVQNRFNERRSACDDCNVLRAVLYRVRRHSSVTEQTADGRCRTSFDRYYSSTHLLSVLCPAGGSNPEPTD